MTVDLIVTTYNRHDALQSVLESIRHQVILPARVIIADDGSNNLTSDVINSYKSEFPVPIIHSWHEDNGFRAAESRNLALSKVKSEYVIIIDGDMILDKYFVKDHLFYAKSGYFLQAGRIMMTERKTSEVLFSPKKVIRPSIFDSGLESRLEKRLLSFRSPFFAKFFNKELNDKSKVRSCNMSFFMNDVIAINGFNNKFVGWGREDSEFVERMLNYGIKGRVLKFVAIAYHLYHKEEKRSSLPDNDKILLHTIKNQLAKCEDGLSKFLK